jgi:hypothetical protein
MRPRNLPNAEIAALQRALLRLLSSHWCAAGQASFLAPWHAAIRRGIFSAMQRNSVFANQVMEPNLGIALLDRDRGAFHLFKVSK